MWEFIVLGFIPGTRIQVTFLLWLVSVTLIGGTLLWRTLQLGHRAYTWLIIARVIVATRPSAARL